ncbi:MAG: glycosyltransferase family 39 protein [Candidatus Omnitrophota bacterium]
MVNKHKIFIYIFLISLIARLVTAIVYLNFDSQALSMDRQPFLSFTGKNSTNIWEVVGDRDGYNTLASNIITYGGIGDVSWRGPSIPPPLYPIFLAVCYFVFGFNALAFFIPHIILDSINAILVLFLSQRIFSSKIGIIASLFYALNPHFIVSSIQLYSETLYFFLVLLVFLFCQKLVSGTSSKYVAVNIGIFMALAALCRSVFLVFIPFIFFWLVKMFYQEKCRIIVLTATIFLSFSLVYGVWVIRDHRVLFAEVSRAACWHTNWSLFDTNNFGTYNIKYKDQGDAFINWVKENPRQCIDISLKRLKILLFQPCVNVVSFRHKVVSRFIFFTIYPLGYLGIAKAIRKKNKIAILILLFISSTIILHALISIEGELRYRLPVELFISIFAAYGLNAVFGTLQCAWYNFRRR